MYHSGLTEVNTPMAKLEAPPFLQWFAERFFEELCMYEENLSSLSSRLNDIKRKDTIPDPINENKSSVPNNAVDRLTELLTMLALKNGRLRDEVSHLRTII